MNLHDRSASVDAATWSHPDVTADASPYMADALAMPIDTAKLQVQPDVASIGAPISATRDHEVSAQNATAPAVAYDVLVSQLFEAQVERTPAAVALSFGTTTLTYRELNNRANQMAQLFHDAGVKPGDVVGLALERSAELVVALWGILKAGATYVPIDPEYPPARMSYILENAQIQYIVTQQALTQVLPATAAALICIDTAASHLAALPTENPLRRNAADDLAYIIYTSGSTGQPKGVQISHRSLVNTFAALQQQPGMQADDTMLAHTTITFDIAIVELCLVFLTGARAVMIPRTVAMNGQALADVISEQHVTVLQATPTMWRLLLDQGWQGAPDLMAWTGGEHLTPQLTRQLLPRVGSLWNFYGPTEATIWCSNEQITEPDAPITVGRPIANDRFYILDEQRQPVPTGTDGELYIAGTGLARGYQGRPDLTAASFVPDPFQTEPQARMYRTGDRARFLPDGRVVCLGRLDAQVKVRGYRIELSEIEATLSRHPAISLAVVTVQSDAAGFDQLVAYYQLLPDGVADWTSLHDFVRAALPAYMIPSRWVEVAEFARTSSGKIDRRALPEPPPLPTLTPATTDTGSLEQRLIALWQELLVVPTIAPDDNFFYLGGNSLLAARLVEQIGREFGVTMPLATIFQFPTVKDLATVIAAPMAEQPTSLITALHATGTKRPLFYLPGGWAASAFYCYTLAHNLGPDQPFYIVDSVTFDQDEALPSVEAIAAQYVAAIQTIQPHGPYQIAGFCNGAFFALEIARILRAANEEVDPLILVEPMDATSTTGLLRFWEGTSKLLHMSTAARLDLYLRVRHLWKFIQPSPQKRLMDREYLRARDAELDRPFPQRRILRKDYIGVLSWLSERFEQQPLDGPVSIIWDSDDAFFQLQWRKLAARLGAQVDVAFIKGGYLSSRVEHIRDFAKHLRYLLKVAETRRESRQPVEA